MTGQVCLCVCVRGRGERRGREGVRRERELEGGREGWEGKRGREIEGGRERNVHAIVLSCKL